MSNCLIYWVTQKLPHIYTANHATFLIQIRKIRVQICGNFWVTQYVQFWLLKGIFSFFSSHFTRWPRSYRKSVFYFCVSVLGRLRDLQYIFAVTSGSPSMTDFVCVADCNYKIRIRIRISCRNYWIVAASIYSVCSCFNFSFCRTLSVTILKGNKTNCYKGFLYQLLGDPEVTANIYCKSRNLPNTDTQNYSTDLR